MNAVGSRSSRALLLGMLTLYPSVRVPLLTWVCRSFASCRPWPETHEASNCVPLSVPIWTVFLVVIWIVWFLSVIIALLTWPALMRLTISDVSTCW